MESLDESIIDEERAEVLMSGNSVDTDITGECPSVTLPDGTECDGKEAMEGDRTVRCPIIIPCDRYDGISRAHSILQHVGNLAEGDRRFIETLFASGITRLREVYRKMGMMLPVDNAILAALLVQFTPGKVEAIRKLIRCPGLIALPGTDQPCSFYKDLLDVNNAHPGSSVKFSNSNGKAFEIQPGEFFGEPNIGEMDSELWSPFKFRFGEMAPVSELPVKRGKLGDIIDRSLVENSNIEGRVAATHEEHVLLQAQTDELLECAPGLTILCEKNPPYNIIGGDREMACVLGHDGQGNVTTHFSRVSANAFCFAVRVRSVVG